MKDPALQMDRNWKVCSPPINKTKNKNLNKIKLTDTLPDAIETDCSKCSEKQKEKSENVLHFLIENKPEDWEQLEQIYDTESIYKEKYLMEKQLNEMKSGEKN